MPHPEHIDFSASTLEVAHLSNAAHSDLVHAQNESSHPEVAHARQRVFDTLVDLTGELIGRDSKDGEWYPDGMVDWITDPDEGQIALINRFHLMDFQGKQKVAGLKPANYSTYSTSERIEVSLITSGRTEKPGPLLDEYTYYKPSEKKPGEKSTYDFSRAGIRAATLPKLVELLDIGKIRVPGIGEKYISVLRDYANALSNTDVADSTK